MIPHSRWPPLNLTSVKGGNQRIKGANGWHMAQVRVMCPCFILYLYASLSELPLLNWVSYVYSLRPKHSFFYRAFLQSAVVCPCVAPPCCPTWQPYCINLGAQNLSQQIAFQWKWNTHLITGHFQRPCLFSISL